jgi:uncharacterized protein YdeI (YjbR/CyaY-like superfamily)
MTKPSFFTTPARFRAWLEKNHASKDDLWVGFYRKATGKPSITWPESVDEALCFGWIDGIRRSIDDHSYMNRFTPRRPRSHWSAVNIAKAHELIRTGRMQPAGQNAFDARDEAKSRQYSYERETAVLDAGYEERLRSNRKARTWFEAQPPGYRRTVAHWIMSAKRKETRERRLGILIQHSAAGRRVPPLRRPGED